MANGSVDTSQIVIALQKIASELAHIRIALQNIASKR
jgi:hypothetical protein